MSNPENPSADRWEELQITRLLFGLSPDEQDEFDRLLAQAPEDQSQLFEQVVASLDVAWSDPTSMPLPDHLRQAIRSRALLELTASAVQPADSVPRPNLNRAVSSRFPWIVTAVCMLVTAMTLWNSGQPFRNPIANVKPLQQRSNLMSSATDLLQVAWTDGPTAIKDVAGDVVWSPAQQRGFMRFRGLPVNDPAKEQYQLWIFDRNQQESTPIDGGVFDISTQQENIIPIQAKLHVKEAYLFAVTIEKPGGVVVSSRERLPLLAKVE